MNQLLKTLAHNEAFKEFKNGSHDLGNLSLIEETLMIAQTYLETHQSMLIVKNNLYSAQNLYNSLDPLLKDDVLLFSVEDNMRIDAIAASPEALAARIETLNTILKKENCVVVAHTGSLLSYLPNPNLFRAHCIDLQINDEIGFETMKELLFDAGYQRVTYVDQPLTYASRGGIIDVFSLNYDYPLRIEFFDDVVDSIRFFDISEKKTISKLDSATIICASDILFTNDDIEEISENLKKRFKDNPLVDRDIEKLKNQEKESSLKIYYGSLDKVYSILDYMKDPRYIISTLEECKENQKMIIEENVAYIQEMSSIDECLPIFTFSHDFNQITDNAMFIHQFISSSHPIFSNIEEIPIVDIKLEQKLESIIKLSETYKVYLSVNEAEKEIISKLNNYPFNYKKFPIREGFIANNEKIALYTSKELFDTVHENRRFNNKFKNAEELDDYMKLQQGDFIVHKLYGVGKYLGIETREVHGIHKDFLKIVYKENDILYVPLEQFHLVRKFVSKEGAVPKLNKLGSNDWVKAKARVQENVKILADRLVKLYALREDKIGFAYSKDTEMQKQFENEFEYDLTNDQKQAIKEIKKDMESYKPMDRLLCGDVGFGKTEVAFRGAFKAIMDNKQVAFLCPTTILSHQHLETALERFKNFPVNIKVINRYVTQKEATLIKKDLKAGKIDLLIGTHRLLSKDIRFKDLGLLIIDEEQRFGVEHKEKIKELKNSVDVLSLSATPIPRTLQMSLVGIRSLSQLNTPPHNRLSVQTYVVEKDESLVKEVIQRELARNGQVFYLFNNVIEIYSIAMKLKSELRGVKIGVAHGKMSKEDIEDVMYKFTTKQYQILVCTTIIETGIDIPNANTIIIDNADRFGLSQLYQIKGRVGRSSRLAYAYLMYAPQKQLTDVAAKRLRSMKEFARLGSGYKIALRDLTIRGAGELLGPKQAGFIDTVGMDMYIEMLHEAIDASKGIKKEKPKEQKKSNLKVDAYIPEKFEEEDYEKISLYQQIDAAKSNHELEKLSKTIIDNYGRLPKAVELLFEKKRLDLLINHKHVEKFSEYDKYIRVTFTEAWSNTVNGVELFKLVSTLSKELKIVYRNKKIEATINKDGNYLDIMIEFINVSLKL